MEGEPSWGHDPHVSGWENPIRRVSDAMEGCVDKLESQIDFVEEIQNLISRKLLLIEASLEKIRNKGGNDDTDAYVSAVSSEVGDLKSSLVGVPRRIIDMRDVLSHLACEIDDVRALEEHADPCESAWI